jgi:putative flavoprotein involved in K+ transport
MTPNVETRPYEVVVVGGSQAGLAVGYHLRRRGLRFLILDSGPDVGHVWRSRWDSLTLFTSAQYSGLPGMDFPAEKDTYPSKDDVAAYLESFASAFDLPVRLNAKVTSLRQEDGGYLLATEAGDIQASQVVVTTGPFQIPLVPPVASGLDATVAQIHSAHYRRPADLPHGEVLVVGGGNSGFQIAEELAATRKVSLAVGTSMPSLPQRWLGRDLFWWLTHLGLMKASVDSRLGRRLAQRDVLIGSSEKRLRRAGVTFRKRLQGADGRRAIFADESHLVVDAVVWATGYRPDFSWIEIAGIKDEKGRIVHRRGVTAAPGIFFVGLPWQHTRGSALLGFVKEDAAFIVETIAAGAKHGATGLPSSSPGLSPTGSGTRPTSPRSR